MASIEDFVNRRWVDAKNALRELDSEFVSRIESQVRLNALNLATPWSSNELERKPYRRLSKSWHNLLEACAELLMQVSFLEESTTVFAGDVHDDTPSIRAGRQALFHFRSWVINAQALTERVCGVIDCSARVYISDQQERKELSSPYKNRVQEISGQIREIRNEYLHGNKSWAKGITEDQLWEGIVACGLAPRKFHDEFIYPEQGDFLKSGKYQYFGDGTMDLENRLGLILEEFEHSILIK